MSLPVQADRERATRVPGPRPDRPRIAFTVMILAAAMPVRLSQSFPAVHSISILDVVLLGAAGTLVLDTAFRPLDPGYKVLFRILCVPLLLSVTSIAWSQDPTASVRASIIYAEGIVAYLFVIRELSGLSPDQVMTHIKRYAYLLIVPGILLLLHVPGFAPEVTGVKKSAGDYLSYYTRLSHPVLGRSNNLASVLAFFAPLLLYWGHTRGERRFTLAGVVTLVAIILTFSRGVLLAFVVAALVYAPFSVPRRRGPGLRRGFAGKLVAILVLSAVAVFIFYAVDPTGHETLAGRFSLVNIKERGHIMSLGLSKVAERPLLGFGAGTIPDHAPLLEAELSVHNTYLQQVVYYGIPLGVVVSAALLGTAAFFLSRRWITGVAGVAGYVLIVQLVAFLWESSFEGTVLKVIFFLSIGLAAALVRAAETEAGWRPERFPDGERGLGEPLSEVG